ncbi:Arc family DNA-binding protein [Burkholderia ambifaria]|uniref:Arc family DNA-binding protein n=1 Tax=Burkholderia ambifaria TaxID=152480 RepID=UPI00158C517F|nr:Arc family DNA-binding protein [Burkholderia ambifaria]MBR8344243.1 Arc family DNA-binding protein [Burkholderia ambifaria]
MTKPTQPPSRTADQFVVRFPDGMRDRIAEEAKANNRSMNAEIVARLEASLARDAEPPGSDQAAELLAENKKLRLEMAKLRNAVRFRRASAESPRQATGNADAGTSFAAPKLIARIAELNENSEKLQAEVQTMVDLLKGGLSQADIARMLGITQAKVAEIAAPTKKRIIRSKKPIAPKP